MRIHRRRRHALWLVLLAFALFPSLRSVRAEPDLPVVEVHVLDGTPAAGRFVRIDAEALAIEPEAGAARTLPVDSLREIRFPSRDPEGAGIVRHRVTLVGGETLVGRTHEPTADGFELEVPGVGRVPVSFEILRTLEVLPAEAGPCYDEARKNPPSASADVAFVRSGDKYEGTLLDATAEQLVFEDARGRKQSLAWDDLHVMHLDNDDLEPATGLQSEVELVNGSRITTAGPIVSRGSRLMFGLRSAPEEKLSADVRAVRALRWKGGRFVYASDLPFESVFTPYLPAPKSDALGVDLLQVLKGVRVNRRQDGCPLRVGGVVYRYGFAVNSKSAITIPLDGSYTSFSAGFGIDDSVLQENARLSNVDARVLGDGKILWKRDGVEHAAGLLPVGPVDVTGVKSLVLEVDFGERKNVLDRASWLDPVLVRR